MKKLCLALPLSLFFSVSNAQNVGIGELTPGAKLTIKGIDALNKNLLVKTNVNDTSFFIYGHNHYINGFAPSSQASLTLNNKYFLPIDNAQLGIVASGEVSGGFASGSFSRIDFSNINNPNSMFSIYSYSGNVNQNSWSLYYSSPAVISALLSIKDNGNTGLGTFTPTARLQINHRSSISIPTLNLYDSSATIGPILQFGNSGGASNWQVRTTINTSSDEMNFINSGAIHATLRSNGNLGIGTTNPNFRLQLHNASGSTVSYTQYTNPITGAAITDGFLVGINHLGQGLVVHQEINKIYLGTAGVIRMTIGETGNVGVGIDPPVEKLDVNGNIKLTGEVNRSSTGTSNLLPIAYGNISSTGFIQAGSGNFSVSKVGTGLYIITITGESYQFQQYITVVTAIGSTVPIIATTGSGSGNLHVYTYLTSGASTDNNFHFVVYKQ